MSSIPFVLATLLAQEQGAGLTSDHLYHGVDHPILLEARVDRNAATIDLVLMDEDGAVLAVPRSIAPGRFDLMQVMPAALQVVMERQRACYLQMVVAEEPVGSALVLEPMLSRMVPVTRIAPHPVTGRAHTKIVGWELESDGPPVRKDGGPDTELGASPGGDAAPSLAERVFAGLRVYLERDARLETSLGEIVVAFRPDEAPNTAWNFRHLVEGGFYRGVVFHRVVPLTLAGEPFVIQAGDPSRTGDGGPGYWLPLEPSGLAHDFGVVSMARADHPDSAGSQFFICLSRSGTARLDGQYCAFACAVSGADTIQAIANVELADVARGRPVEPPVILDAALVPAPPRIPGAGRPDECVSLPVAAAPTTKPGRVPR